MVPLCFYGAEAQPDWEHWWTLDWRQGGREQTGDGQVLNVGLS